MNWYAKLCQTIVDTLENKSSPFANEGPKDAAKDNDMGPFFHNNDPPDNWDGDLGDFGYDLGDAEENCPRTYRRERSGIPNTKRGYWETRPQEFVAIREMTDLHIANTMSLICRMHSGRLKSAVSDGELPVRLISRPFGDWTSKYMELSHELRRRAKERSQKLCSDPADKFRELAYVQSGPAGLEDFNRLLSAFRETQGPSKSLFEDFLMASGYKLPETRPVEKKRPTPEGQLRFNYDGPSENIG